MLKICGIWLRTKRSHGRVVPGASISSIVYIKLPDLPFVICDNLVTILMLVVGHPRDRRTKIG
jgi:hypothetical protein